jgi:hypothetical protein
MCSDTALEERTIQGKDSSSKTILHFIYNSHLVLYSRLSSLPWSRIMIHVIVRKTEAQRSPGTCLRFQA